MIQKMKTMDIKKERPSILIVNIIKLSPGSAEMRGTKIITSLNKAYKTIVATYDGTYPVDIPVEVKRLVKSQIPVLKYLFLIFSIRSLIKKHKINIVIAEQYRSAFFCILATIFTKTITVLDYHGVWVEEHLAQTNKRKNSLFAKLIRIADNWILKKSDYIITVSNKMNDYLINKNINENKLFKFYNLVKIEKFSSIKKPNIKNEMINYLENFKGMLIGYFGNFIVWQGIPLLLKAYSKFLKKNPDARKESRIVLVGGKSPSFDLDQLTSELDIKENVIFIKLLPHEYIPYIMSLIDILALPRPKNLINEVAFPTKFAEYLMMNKPLLVTNVGDVGELVKKHNLGYVSFPEEEDMSRVIEKIWKEKENWKLFNKNAEFAKKMFSIESSDDILIKFIWKIYNN